MLTGLKPKVDHTFAKCTIALEFYCLKKSNRYSKVFRHGMPVKLVIKLSLYSKKFNRIRLAQRPVRYHISGIFMGEIISFGFFR